MMELTYAKDASFGFLPEDSRHLALDPLEPGDLALFITSQDGEGITIIGSLEELRTFAGRLEKRLAEKSTK